MTIHRDNSPDGMRYRLALISDWNAPKGDATIGDSLTDYRDESSVVPGARYYVDMGEGITTGGFIVKPDGELVGVFSSIPGRGDALISAALNAGATHLDCFDGYLTEFYARHGFREYRREPNWTPGGPAVVYMGLPSYVSDQLGWRLDGPSWEELAVVEGGKSLAETCGHGTWFNTCQQPHGEIRGSLAESIAKCTGAVESTVTHEHVEYGPNGERTVVTDSTETYRR